MKQLKNFENIKKSPIQTILSVLFFVVIVVSTYANKPKQSFEDTVTQDAEYGYLFCHMSGRGEWTAYALSRDGYHYHDLINGDPIFNTEEHARIEGGTRDAFICRKHDNSGYLMVTTDMCVAKSKQWYNYGIDLLVSDDLINWTSETFDFRQGPSIFSDKDASSPYKDYSNIKRVWAPQILWDADYQWSDGRKGGYFIYFSMLNPDEEKYDRVYYSYANESFTTLTQPKLLFDWGYATIDADINYLESDSLFHMLIKKEGGHPGIFATTSKSLYGPWNTPNEENYISFEGKQLCEGPSAFQLIEHKDWCVAYIEYSSKPKHYRICKADEFMSNFNQPVVDIEGVNGPQHGSFLKITKAEYDRLQSWSDSLESQHILPNKDNPIISGLYADPEILYSNKTKQYYLYPTTDGIIGWENHDAHAYCSKDIMKNWSEIGVIFDLETQCSWAKKCLWAPCIIEKEDKKSGQYKYYYYFTGDKKIGVAVANDPAGPFVDALGKPLLTEIPQGAGGGQVIDPDVFQDPSTGKCYLYWGNGFLAVSELGDDMTSIISTKVLINHNDKNKYNYNEGSYVFFRNGLYYFMWSENDTRSTNYQVRYLISESPTEFIRDGKPAKTEPLVVLSKDPSQGIWGTGHHAIIQQPDTDNWFIVYHRFARPNAIKLGWDAGYNREICVDSLNFNEDGTIKPVKPSL